MFKMRELNGAAVVKVNYVMTDDKTSDIFTTILTRQPFEKHRDMVMNIYGGRGLERVLDSGDKRP